MKNILLYTSLLVILLSTSCTDDLDSINTNPNAPIDAEPELLLRQVLYNYGEEMSYEGFVAGNLLGQYFTMVDFNLFDRHDLNSPQLGGNPWPVFYRNLRDNEILISTSDQLDVYRVFKGPALILKAYMSAALTDIYGDVPFSEALKGKAGNTLPKYDMQEDIYMGEGGIFELLDKGIKIINDYNGVPALEGDILFDGDLQAWIRFANSLKIKYILRLSGVRPDLTNQLQSIYDEGQFISANFENAAFDFTGNQPNTFRMAILRSGDFNLYVMSKTIENILKSNDDSRMATLFRPAESTPGEFHGLNNGPNASTTSISVSDFSLTGTIFRENTSLLDANFMTSSETMFLLAEAAERGFIDADAQQLYENGIKQAFEYWQTSIPDNFLTNSSAAYKSNGADPIEQILTQKWLMNIINGYEGWIEYRRTGFPELAPISASLNDDLIPIRMPYPNEEAALNAVNYNAATVDNNNSINAPVWWDVD